MNFYQYLTCPEDPSVLLSSVSFLWAPSHSGLLGNEAADQLAGSVSTLSPAKPVLSFHDIIASSKSLLFSKWNDSYASLSDPRSPYFLLQPQLPPFPWYKFTDLSHRKHIVKLCRLRFGHTCLPAHIHRFLPNVSPFCPLHPEDEIHADPHHIFSECPELHLSRRYTCGIRQTFGNSLVVCSGALVSTRACLARYFSFPKKSVFSHIKVNECLPNSYSAQR